MAAIAFLAIACSAAPRCAISQSLSPLAEVVQVAAGGSHACALTRAGGVRCWGSNGFGQLGDGAAATRVTAVAVAGLANGVSAISAGGHHTCALTNGGAVLCWGNNSYGQLGDGTTEARRTPVAVAGLVGQVAAIDAADTHTCALISTGAVFCWGSNRTGQLGDGTTTDRLAPVAVSGLGNGVTAVATGDSHIISRGGHSCALTNAGVVLCWGDNTSGQLGNGTTTQRLTPVAVTGLASGVTAVAAGGEFSCALSTAGAVKCWGRNFDGQLGDGTTTNRLIPVAAAGLASGVAAISAGFYHACALSNAGAVQCWGANAYGALGDGSTTNRLTAVAVSGLANRTIAIAAGGINVVGETGHSCAVTSTGAAQCWGQNSHAQLGDGTQALRLTPVPTAGLGSGTIAISAGALHTCALRGAGTVDCWGSNAFGQIGDGSLTPRRIPAAVTGLGGTVAAISAGGRHTCALTGVGAVLCWGDNSRGQLGDGSTTQRLTPVAVTGLGSGVIAISAGDLHTCALTSARGVQCWGYNGVGTLGDGTTTQRLTPVAAIGLSAEVSAVTTGDFHTCALTLSGAIRCWGSNSQGQLGDGGTTQRLAPVLVMGLGSGATAVTAGGYHTCAIAISGAVQCWGFNFAGQLGDGTTTQRVIPVPVAGLASGVTAIDAGNAHACAVINPAAVQCWGTNFFGELGDGTTRIQRAPVSASGLGRDVVAITAGGDFAQGHSCAVTRAGSVLCNGSNDIGQLGVGGRNYGLPGEVVVESFSSNAASAGNQPSAKTATDASGRYLFFQSRASSLLPAGNDTNNASDIYRRDLQTNAIVRVSVDNAGAQITGDSIEPSVSGNGRFAVYVAPNAGVAKVLGETGSAAGQRVKGGGFAVYLRDLLSGTTQRVGAALPSGAGTEPEISANGNAVVWGGINTDPANGAIGQENVFLVPLLPSGDTVLVGSELCLSCLAIGTGGKTTVIANGASHDPDVSADGRRVVFATEARNLVPGSTSPCAGGVSEILLRDLISGTTQRVSPPPGIANCGSIGAIDPSIDYAGLNVAYGSDAPVKPADINLLTDIYVFNTASAGSVRVSESLLGHDGLGNSIQPEIAGDGRSVVFRSAARNLEPREADNNEIDDIHVFRMDRPEIRRVSRNRRGDQADRISNEPVLNYNGTRVAFDSDATNLLVDSNTGQLTDTNNVTDVFQVSNPTTGEVVFRCGME